MEHGNPRTFAPCKISDRLPEQAFLIIGAGHFGERAAGILKRRLPQRHPIFIIDRDEDRLSGIEAPHSRKILCDGIQFLLNNIDSLPPSNTIIPAVPFHLAGEYLKTVHAKDVIIRQIKVQGEIKRFLPFTWEGSEGSLLVSYADFPCPDDCPEPEGHCTLTGDEREYPLYQLLDRLNLPGFSVHIVRSHQLAPGLGGYKIDALSKLISRVREKGNGRWLIGTACRCHGTLTALEVKNPKSNDPSLSHA